MKAHYPVQTDNQMRKNQKKPVTQEPERQTSNPNSGKGEEKLRKSQQRTNAKRFNLRVRNRKFLLSG